MWKKENLRKNFLRVKQIADQNLGRSEKSEVLTEDLLTIEKRVETVKQVCSNISKKLTSSLQAQGETVEKRLKKLPEMSIAHCLIESSALLGTGQESLLGVICQLCGDAQNNLAREQLQYEINIEKDVLMPLQGIFENDLPAILKARKHLTKTTLDMDSAKGRHTTALRQSQLPGTNMTAASAKVDQIKEELDEAEAKVEYVKDNLAVEMCSFISKETEHSQKLLALVEAQAAYHEKALKAIKAVIPRMQSAIDNNPTKPVFGNSLEEHLRVTGRDIAVVLEACVVTLLYTGMNEEGLFRIAGAASKLKKLKACFDANIVDMEEFRHDPHTVAGTLKQYLRELPEPLLTYQLYSEFMQAATLPKEKIITALKPIIERLPDKNYNNFRYLIKFLDKLSRNSDVNKMTATNIAIVIAPNLLWSQTENAPNMLTTGSLSTIIEAVVSNADYFYPEDLDFTKTKKGTAPAISKENLHSSNSSLLNKTDDISSAASSASRQESNRNSRLDFYNSQTSTQYSRTSSQNSHGEAGHRSESVSETSDILLDTNVSYDNISLDDSTSATEGESSSNHSRNHSSSSRTNHPSNQSPIRYINQSQTGSSSPRSRSVPPAQVAKSFNSDVYSTITALQSLGSNTGSWSDYFSKVQAVRDETFHHTPSSPPVSGNLETGDTTPPVVLDTNIQATREESKGVDMSLKSSEIDFYDVGEHTPPSLSPVQPRQNQKTPDPESALAFQVNSMLTTPPSGARPVSPNPGHGVSGLSQSQGHGVSGIIQNPGHGAGGLSQSQGHIVSGVVHNPVHIVTGVPGHSPSSSVGSGDITTNIFADSNSPEQPGSSPRVQRRVVKKAAPPPPPDRPYSVAVTASVSKPNTNPYQTWPRHQSAPLASPETGNPELDPLEEVSSAKPTIPERPQFPTTRQASHPPERPERPKAPPPSVPQGHNRSSSTGGMVVPPQPSPHNLSSNGQDTEDQSEGASKSITAL